MERPSGRTGPNVLERRWRAKFSVQLIGKPARLLLVQKPVRADKLLSKKSLTIDAHEPGGSSMVTLRKLYGETVCCVVCHGVDPLRSSTKLRRTALIYNPEQDP